MGIGFIQQFLADEAGATALEYGFFVAFVAAVLLGGAQALAISVQSLFNTVGSSVSDAMGP